MRELGNKGEDIAADYLITNGYLIIERNFFAKYGELDIIVLDQNTDPSILVFVEVKSYAPNSLVDPKEAVTPAKKRRLLKAARYFLHKNNFTDTHCRFDFISVEKGSIKEHLENIEIQ